MKFYPDKIHQLMENINSLKIKALLLYGPDKGYIKKICQIIIHRLSLLPRVITDAHLHVNQFDMLLNTQNFFGKKECLKIFISANQFNAEYKTILRSEFIHFPILIVDELPAHTELRKFFEAENNLAAVGCYYLDAQSVSKLILNKLTKIKNIIPSHKLSNDREMVGDLGAQGKSVLDVHEDPSTKLTHQFSSTVEFVKRSIDPDALAYCTLHLQGDYQSIDNELDKLIYFTHDRSLITIDDAIKVISNNITANGDDLCVYFINKELAKLFEELAKLLQQNISMVLIIRALIRYYLNIYAVLVLVKNGMTLDQACKTLSPPIFFKQLANFKKITNSAAIVDVITALSVLQQAEVQFKLSNNSFDFYQHVYCKIHL
ncbi:DNA polymerase III subunit delta [Candidatus Trichorickettsia mobilis]|uniref:DNA polymerase III subunit delta n=1 Tax=Candidatus Trichorickettsia mobilis TaxID=1346319 RepID=UPI002930C37D|nr:DNA polymerase III subunit delta [Candidatus Trichorickettsia mobilis]